MHRGLGRRRCNRRENCLLEVRVSQLKPGPRRDGRKAAKDVPELAMLQAAVGYSVGGRFPIDSLAERFTDVPRKVFVARQRKLVERGWMASNWMLTAEGLNRLKEMEASG